MLFCQDACDSFSEFAGRIALLGAGTSRREALGAKCRARVSEKPRELLVSLGCHVVFFCHTNGRNANLMR